MAAAPSACGDDDDSNGVPDAAAAPDAATRTDASPPDAGADQVDAAVQAGAVHFHLDVANDVPESIYVQLNGADAQPAWIAVSHAEGGERVYLIDRCEIEECENPSGVCGAALPRVRDITAGTATGSIAFDWDGLDSVIDPVAGCERREAAPAGAYRARFCFSLNADLEPGGGDPASEQGAAGQVLNPVCVDVDFSLPEDSDVGHALLGG